jgi:hypothetical protein
MGKIPIRHGSYYTETMNGYDEVSDMLTERADTADRRRLRSVCERAAQILRALESRDHPESDVDDFLERFRSSLETDPRPGSVSKVVSALLTHLEKEHGLVVPGHYRDQWTGIGMAAFGVPLGVAFGTALGNMAYIGIGIPLGLAIGSSLGAKKDAEAKRDGRQLEMETE